PRVNAGGFGSVEAGGAALNTDLVGGAQFDVYGSASGTFVGADFGGDGVENVFAGGVDSGALVFGEQHVHGSANAAAVSGGFEGDLSFFGRQFVESGGLVTSTTVANLATQMVQSGGTASATTISAGGLAVIAAGGTDLGATVAGSQDVFGFTSDTLILPGGLQIVEVGGLAVGTIVDAMSGSGTQRVFGSAVGTIVLSGDVQFIESGGFSLGSTVSSGGQEFVSAGGLASGTTLMGGTLFVQGSATGTFI